MLSYRHSTVYYFHWEFKPILSYSKPYTFSTFFGEKKERKNAFTHQSAVVFDGRSRCGNGVVDDNKSEW